MSDPIAQIRESRDKALDALTRAYDAIGDQIAQTTQIGPTLNALTKRYEDLRSERAAIFEAATEEAMALPGVVAAVATLNDLAQQMNDTAAELPNANKLLTTAGAILSLGQKFADAIANARKG